MLLKTMSVERLAVISLFGSGFMWGLAWLPLKYFASLGLNGLHLALTAYTAIGLIAIPILAYQYRYWRHEYGLLISIGLFFGWANIAFNTAMMMGSVVKAMLLFYLLPAWGVIGGTLFLKERLTPVRIATVALALVGVVVMMGGFRLLFEPWALADMLALSAGLFYTAASIANRAAVHIPLASRTLVSFVGASMLALLFYGLLHPAWPDLSVSTGAWLLAYAVFGMLFATLLTTYGVTHIEAGRASILQVFELLVAVTSSILLGQDSMESKDWIGGALIVSASLIEAIAGQPPRQYSTP